MNPLRQRMIEDMQVRHLAPGTQSAYVQQVAAFARHFTGATQQLQENRARRAALMAEVEKLDAEAQEIARLIASPEARALLERLRRLTTAAP